MKTFIKYDDPAHGWLRVPRQLIFDLDIQDLITSYSYQYTKWVYLEEDSDLACFMRSMEDSGSPVIIHTKHSNNPSRIRSYSPFNQYSELCGMSNTCMRDIIKNLKQAYTVPAWFLKRHTVSGLHGKLLKASTQERITIFVEAMEQEIGS